MENIVKNGFFNLEENGMFFLNNRVFDFSREYFCYEKKHFEENKQKRDFFKKSFAENKNYNDYLSIFIPDKEFRDVPGCCIMLATRTWEFIVKKRWERKLKNKPAIAYSVSECIFETCWNPKNKIQEKGDKKLIVTPSGKTVATITETIDLTLDEIQKRHDLLNSILGHKMFRFVIMEYQSRFFETNDREPGKIEIKGGREKLGEMLDVKSNVDLSKMYEILQAGQGFSIQTLAMSLGGLWTFTEKKGIGKTKPHITIDLGEALKPHYLYKFPKDKQILLPIAPLPALVEPKKYHAEQAVAQFLVIQHIVSNRKFLRNHEGGFFDDDVLEGIAEQAGLPMSVMQRAWEQWQYDSESSEAFIEKIGKQVYHIAKNKTFYEVRVFIDQLAKLSMLGSQRASKKSFQKK